MAFQFEKEVTLPSDPYEAAVIFIAIMAYPEKGAGQIGNAGQKFANALVDYCLWACRHARGLDYLREAKGPDYLPPQRRQFEGKLQKGLKRIHRRAVAESVYGTRLLQGFFEVGRSGNEAIAAGTPEKAFLMNKAGPSLARPELWGASTPSALKILRNQEKRWSKDFALNQTGRPADSERKAKDLYRRAYKPSIPVMHMIFAFGQACEKHGPKISSWEHREPVKAMLLNFDKWIWDTIDHAEQWRQIQAFTPMQDIRPDQMVRLIRSDC